MKWILLLIVVVSAVVGDLLQSREMNLATIAPDRDAEVSDTCDRKHGSLVFRLSCTSSDGTAQFRGACFGGELYL
jgi:hypothetical protein